MAEIALERAAGLAYRAAGPAGGDPVLLLHGYPESSYMWRHVMPALAAAGWSSFAPDLPGFGDSPPDPPGTWERHVEAIERFRSAAVSGRLVLVVHDWGGLIGLRWACEHPDAMRALVISSSGFFPDGKWHGLAKALRTEGTGEQLIAGMTEDGFGEMLRGVAPFGPDSLREYWKAFADDERRRGHLELYRSGDFGKLEPYRGCVAALGVPALLLWGENDPFAPVAGAHRFAHELPGAELVILDGGHFIYEEQPERTATEILRFLERLP